MGEKEYGSTNEIVNQTNEKRARYASDVKFHEKNATCGTAVKLRVRHAAKLTLAWRVPRNPSQIVLVLLAKCWKHDKHTAK